MHPNSVIKNTQLFYKSPKTRPSKMTTTSPSCIAYVGLLPSIPTDASPGLLYLKAYLEASDSLESKDGDIGKLVKPGCVMHNNSAPPVIMQPMPAPPTNSEAPSKRAKRSAALQSLTRELRRAWDIDNGNGKRTVIYDSKQYFTFAADVENPVCMPEAGTMELERVPEGKEGGIGGWWAVELRSWHDRVGLREKRAQLGC
jgi:hypothetical protein